MQPNKHSTPVSDKNISISGDVKDSAVIIGDNNTVNQTFIQKFFNIFKSDAETLEQRNRRILLSHVENAWIKGVLDASLHGAALLDLGIKQEPEAVTKYPWAIKKESTDETLPAGTSMLEIFDSIGMGRSLLILGSPGSGKTTMLLELARQLIQRARGDVIEPIPMVFNLASWTEKLSLANWLAQELNNLYNVPRKTAPDWVKGNKLLLLLDGLDEVRQESRAKCVDAINSFRKENGMTSLAVCSRSQDYADLNAKLSFEGAIEVQPLTQGQIAEFFNHFGDEMTGIKQVLEKDSSLCEMAKTPLFLSIMLMAYRDKQAVEILVSGDEKARRKHLFDKYIERMFERRSKNDIIKGQSVLYWLSWLAHKMMNHHVLLLMFEEMQPYWLDRQQQSQYKFTAKLVVIPVIIWLVGIFFGLNIDFIMRLIISLVGGEHPDPFFRLAISLVAGLIIGLYVGLSAELSKRLNKISTVESLTWNWKNAGIGLFGGLVFGLISGLSAEQLDKMKYPGQKLDLTAKHFRNLSFIFGLIIFLASMPSNGPVFCLIVGMSGGLSIGLMYGGFTLIQHYTLRFILSRNNLLPWRLVPFLDHCVDLIFLRRVGGGYIFIHRLLMEHFAEMYVETPK